MKLPAQGIPRQDLISQMRGMRAHDANWQNGNTFSLVYYAGEEIIELAKLLPTLTLGRFGFR